MAKRSKRPKSSRADNQARPGDRDQVGPLRAGQAGSDQQLSRIADASSESVEELADTDQAIEAGIVEGSEDAADHPERPVHTHLEYPRPDDFPPKRGLK